MSFVDYVLTNYTTFFEMIGLLVILFISAHITRRMKNYTRIAVALLLFTSIISFFESYTQTFEHLSLWRPILTATKYTMYPLILMFIVLVMSQVKDIIPNKLKIIFMIPEFICIPIFYTSQWTHLVCYFTEGNHYLGGMFSLLPYFLFGFYFILFLVVNILYLKNYSSQDRIMVLYISVGAILGVILCMIFDRKDDYTPIFASALIFYYLFLYIHRAKIDPLTGLFNRQSYYQETLINDSTIDALLSIDMNDLKYFNDTFGHCKGDEALITIANIFREHSDSKRIYRVGGDEFVILYKDKTEEEVVQLIENMKEALSHTEYVCAFGYSMKEKNIHEMEKLADKRMYEDKETLKHLVKGR